MPSLHCISSFEVTSCKKIQPKVLLFLIVLHRCISFYITRTLFKSYCYYYYYYYYYYYLNSNLKAFVYKQRFFPSQPHCVKSAWKVSKYGVFSGLHFSVFELHFKTSDFADLHFSFWSSEGVLLSPIMFLWKKNYCETRCKWFHAFSPNRFSFPTFWPIFQIGNSWE